VTDFSQYPSLKTLTSRVLAGWPEHGDYIEKSFDGRPQAVTETSERIASCVLRLAEVTPGGLDGLCDDYRFLCEKIVLPEELHFRRYNRYRLSKFVDALNECYENAPFMARYMNGLLVSNVVWNNHACAISSFVHEYLPSLRAGSDHLEIGPGHGLFLYFAATSPTVASVSGWDVSPTSIDMTRKALSVLGIARPANLMLQNMFEASAERSPDRYDSIVMSEILEHLEDPVAALKAASAWLRPGGTIWVNVPANSPAPDHIFLVESPEHACDLVRAAGLDVTASHGFPMTGATMEKARKRKLAISCVVVGRKQ
jgi:2-polyprenyl-3-methyl-5-hydroxy-6-metoxy-1,4-benzoquinol methylase